MQLISPISVAACCWIEHRYELGLCATELSIRKLNACVGVRNGQVLSMRPKMEEAPCIHAVDAD